MSIRGALPAVFAAMLASSAAAQTLRFGELRRMLPAVLDSAMDVALGDIDGDGDLDALVANSIAPDRLYRNEGLGRLEDASAQLPLSFDNSKAVALGDVDGDGDLDAFFGNGILSPQPNGLYLNDGTGGFADASGQLPSFSDRTAAVALGDVDGDGDLDVLFGNDVLDRLHLNDGSGVFVDASSQLPPIVGETSGAALGDVDGDGDLDVLLANPGQVRLYLNDGSGVFSDASGQLPPVTGGVAAIAVGDVDGDGDLDAFLGRWGPERLYLNDGVGNFSDASGQLPSISDSTVDVALRDLDGDGDLEGVTVNAYQPVRVYLNDGVGTFVEAMTPFPPTPETTQSLALGDVDGDADLDVFLGKTGQDRLFLNDGSAVFVDVTGPLPAFPDSTWGIVLGDVDGDGDLDVFVGNGGSLGAQQSRLYLNEGQGTFTDATDHLPIGLYGTTDVALGDVDADGDLDAVIANSNIALYPCLLYLNDGSGLFTDATAQLPAIYGQANSLAIGDVDGDGDLDVYLGTGGYDRLYLNDGTGIFVDATGQLPFVQDVPLDLVLGDVDGDGDLDLLKARVPAEGNALYLNNGAGVFVDASAQLPANADYTLGIALGDVDGDGDLDALIGNGSLWPDRLYRNDGSGVFTDATTSLPSVSAFTRDVAFGDVDGDGDLDAVLATGGAGTQQIRLYRNDGTGIFADATSEIPPIPLQPGALALGDLDGDGDLDALVGNLQRGETPLLNLTAQLAWRRIPSVGKALTFDVYGPAWGAWFLAFSLGTANLPIPPFGTLRLDPSQTHQVFASLLDAQGRASITYAVPSSPALVGATVYWQAIVASPARFTNLEITTLTNL